MLDVPNPDELLETIVDSRVTLNAATISLFAQMHPNLDLTTKKASIILPPLSDEVVLRGGRLANFRHFQITERRVNPASHNIRRIAELKASLSPDHFLYQETAELIQRYFDEYADLIEMENSIAALNNVDRKEFLGSVNLMKSEVDYFLAGDLSRAWFKKLNVLQSLNDALTVISDMDVVIRNIDLLDEMECTPEVFKAAHWAGYGLEYFYNSHDSERGVTPEEIRDEVYAELPIIERVISECQKLYKDRIETLYYKTRILNFLLKMLPSLRDALKQGKTFKEALAGFEDRFTQHAEPDEMMKLLTDEYRSYVEVGGKHVDFFKPILEEVNELYKQISEVES